MLSAGGGDHRWDLLQTRGEELRRWEVLHWRMPAKRDMQVQSDRRGLQGERAV